MALIEVYQGNNKTITVTFTQDDGVTPVSMSGNVLYYTARRAWESDIMWNVSATGLGADLANATTGLMRLYLTAQDTDQCPGVYPAGFTLSGWDGSIQTFFSDGDGVSILPAPLILV